MVSSGFYPTLGGAEKQALELSAALAARGVQVRVATRRLPGLAAFEQVRGIAIERLWCAGSGLLNATSFLLSLWSYLVTRSGSYGVIHVHLAGSPATAAALAGRLLGKRVFIKLGGGKGIGELAASSKSLSGRLKLLALRRLRPQFVAVARELAEESRQYLGTVPVHVLPNGVDTRAYQPVDAARKLELRAALGWPSAGLGFVYAGRLSPEKQLPRFLEDWLDVAKKMDAKAFLAFVGDGVEWAVLKEAVTRLRASDRVFLHAAVQDVARVYGAADVFVLPSISEGLSNALLEAMASGLGVLGSRVGGTAEAVTESQNGFLFDPNDDEDIKRQARKFFENPTLSARLGIASRKTAVERYAMDKVAAAWENLYRYGL
jgi:glycosyltransferase involved in cell wall biosynthesis